MKKTAVLLAAILSVLSSYAQINQGDMMLSSSVNYINTTSKNGVNTMMTVTRTKNLNSGISFGYFLTDRFAVGAGLNYSLVKERVQGELYLKDLYLQQSINDNTTNLLTPFIFGEMFIPVVKNLYFSTNLKAGYAFIMSKSNQINAFNITRYDPNTMTYEPFNSEFTQHYLKENANYLGLRLSPKFTYFFTDFFGVNLSLGGIEYNLVNWSFENSVFLANFNPQYWEVGVNFKF